ncbi:MAG: S-methyl-5-thioribose-1-phosphate isomerase [Fimbriimonadales bacterium]|nr:S-methyl-5-thioribose-1-phosphate isomerase [Fimbriimonadales bacterium]
MSVRAFRWESERLLLLDQRRLPQQEVWLNIQSYEQAAEAIRDMAVRGAPAIGIVAAYGMALAARAGVARNAAAATLAASRPTAVNLFWALERMERLPEWTFEAALDEARRIEEEDLEMNLRLARYGAELVPEGARVLTICNTGSLATAGHGTALGIVRTAFELGKLRHVYSCETRPRLQGLRLTAWELMKDGIPFSSIADGAAAWLMAQGMVDFVVAGADRIAANGDTANKIGTYALALAARHHDLPFVVAAPSSTVDPATPSGEAIPIEERSSLELTEIEGVALAPAGCPAYNPAFDVTPGELLSAIVTEQGVFRPPFRFER